MAKNKTKFICQNCGYESPKWLGKCPGCQSWNTLHEEIISTLPKSTAIQTNSNIKPQSITKVSVDDDLRIDTSNSEFNRALGGGIVRGSLVLVGGDPGIGKSTLLLQTSQKISISNHKVLYISGEESIKQIKRRADRIGESSDSLFVFTENQLENIELYIDNLLPEIVIIDSIQTIYNSSITSAPGSVSQVRESTAQLLRIAKSKEVAIIIVGHVTKQGEIAGPRLLEHMVDTVLYFEGERHNTYRILRAVKNRYGSTNEIGIFEMRENGLAEVSNPSEIFLSERPIGVSGSTVVASMEGSRPVLLEIQSLLSPTNFVTPRRVASGVDFQRINLIIAVLEKRIGLNLQNQDAYVNIAGGVKINETGLDLPIAISIVSSFRDKPTNHDDVFIGEIGLTGEVRGVSRIEQRINEAKKLGFKRIIVPKRNTIGWKLPLDIEVIAVQSVSDAIDIAFGG